MKPQSELRDEVVADRAPDISLLALAAVVLRWRRVVLALGVFGGLMGLVLGLLSPRQYVAMAMFIPQNSQATASGLAAAASQFGIRVPEREGGWGPAVYVELLRSRSLLEPIANDTMLVGGRQVPVGELFDIDADSDRLRMDLTLNELRRVITPGEVKNLGAVRVSVSTRWPAVSLQLANRAIEEVSRFNLETRKSEARAELDFVETQAQEAERALRVAEDRLQAFMQRNRLIGSPELTFEMERLDREVALRQQVYTSLLQLREEARIREVRNTPVITILEEPRLPVVGEPRGSIRKAIVGGLLGSVIGIVAALVTEALANARRAADGPARAFFQQVEQATPRILRRKPR